MTAIAPISQQIWDMKYRLKGADGAVVDRTLEDTWRRIARALAEPEQAHLAFALVFELSKVGLEHIRERMMANLGNVDPDLAKRVADGLNMPVPKPSKAAAPVQDMDLSPALRIIGGPLEPDGIKGQTIAILVADGSDAGAVGTLTKAIKQAGARAVIVAPKVGGAKLSDGSMLKADAQLAGYPSVMADAVAIALSDEGTKMLLKEGAAVQFVMDAFVHLKAIGASEAAKPLLDKASVEFDDGVTGLDDAFVSAASKRYWAREPGVRMLP